MNVLNLILILFILVITACGNNTPLQEETEENNIDETAVTENEEEAEKVEEEEEIAQYEDYYDSKPTDLSERPPKIKSIRVEALTNNLKDGLKAVIVTDEPEDSEKAGKQERLEDLRLVARPPTLVPAAELMDDEDEEEDTLQRCESPYYSPTKPCFLQTEVAQIAPDHGEEVASYKVVITTRMERDLTTTSPKMTPTEVYPSYPIYLKPANCSATTSANAMPNPVPTTVDLTNPDQSTVPASRPTATPTPMNYADPRLYVPHWRG